MQADSRIDKAQSNHTYVKVKNKKDQHYPWEIIYMKDNCFANLGTQEAEANQEAEFTKWAFQPSRFQHFRRAGGTSESKMMSMLQINCLN